MELLLTRDELKKLRIKFHDGQGQHDNWSDYVAKAQLDKAEPLIRQDEREMVRIIVLKAIADEFELLGDMPDELWQLLKSRKDLTDLAMKSAVELTKTCITDKFVQALDK